MHGCLAVCRSKRASRPACGTRRSPNHGRRIRHLDRASPADADIDAALSTSCAGLDAPSDTPQSAMFVRTIVLASRPAVKRRGHACRLGAELPVELSRPVHSPCGEHGCPRQRRHEYAKKACIKTPAPRKGCELKGRTQGRMTLVEPVLAPTSSDRSSPCRDLTTVAPPMQEARPMQDTATRIPIADGRMRSIGDLDVVLSSNKLTVAVVCAVVLASLSGPVFAQAPAPTGDPAPASSAQPAVPRSGEPPAPPPAQPRSPRTAREPRARPSGRSSGVAEGTLTLSYQPIDNASVRLEYRHDQAADNAYFGGDVASDSTTQAFVPDRKSQDTVTLGATAWF